MRAGVHRAVRLGDVLQGQAAVDCQSYGFRHGSKKHDDPPIKHETDEIDVKTNREQSLQDDATRSV